MADTESLRKLNIEIALKIMGWLQWDGEDDWSGPPDATFFFAGDNGSMLGVYEDGEENPTLYFDPVKDIESAMTVIEKMRERGYRVAIQGELPNDGGWRVRLHCWRASAPPCARRSFEDSNLSLSIAICRAALSAISEEK